jgi:uncharacterized protein YbaR (Trm112 family)
LHLDLVDVLRCPADHEESPLVALPDTVDGREMLSGTLGCPFCGAEYRVIDGMAWMGGSMVKVEALAGAPARDLPLRLAAMLDLTHSRGTAVIVGGLGRHAPEIRSLTPTPLVLIDPPEPRSYLGLEAVSVVVAGSLPFLTATVASLAAGDDLAVVPLADGARVLRPRGRMVLPASLALTAEFDELARDERFVVAERRADPLVVSIGRRQPPPP